MINKEKFKELYGVIAVKMARSKVKYYNISYRETDNDARINVFIDDEDKEVRYKFTRSKDNTKGVADFERYIDSIQG